MAQYTPVPYVAERRPRNLRLADLYLRQGEQIADSERRSGEIQAQLWGNVGQAVGQAASSAIMAPQVQREQAAKAAQQAQQAELGALQLGEAKREVNERENFDLAMKEGGGAEARTLALLKDRPELQERAQGYFKRQTDRFNEMVKDAATEIDGFGGTVDAANTAIDHLEELGLDKQRTAQYRAAMQTPEGVRTVVDKILGKTPVVPKTREIKVTNPDGTETIRVVEDTPGQQFTSTPPPKAKSLQSENVLLDGKPVLASFDPTSGAYHVNGQDVTARVRPIPPQGPAGGEPLEAVIDPKTGESVLLPRSQARGMRPATTREQPTEDERKTAGFYGQMSDAISLLDQLEGQLSEKELYQIQTLPQEGLVGMANRGELSEPAKRYLRAFEQFTEARLRPVSGAAISDSEFARDRRTYAKQFSETPALNEDRRAARNRALDSLKMRAARALPKDKAGDDGPSEFTVGSFTVKVKGKK